MLCSPRGARTGAGGAFLWVLLVCCASTRAHAEIPPAARAAWLALVHYWYTDGKWVSEVTDPSFFLSAEGPRDPEGEWDADLRGFLAPADDQRPDQHAQCRFPARFVLMKQSLGWLDGDVPKVDCPEFIRVEEGRISVFVRLSGIAR